jgi:hypothetical protein
MQLNEILHRFSEGLLYVDRNTTTITTGRRKKNRLTGISEPPPTYLPGVHTMSENKFVEELTHWWISQYKNDFDPSNSLRREVPYVGIPRAKCDLIFSTDGSEDSNPEWVIEVKQIELVGNNGNNNDFGVAKILSPYLKDRSLIHDIKRLKQHGIGKRKAVIGYCFDYSFETCEQAKILHPNSIEYINNIYEVCKNNDPINGQYNVEPMIQFADEIFRSQNLVKNLLINKFKNAWRHPCGGSGVIFGWELT